MKSGNGKKWLKRMIWLGAGGCLLLSLALFSGWLFLQTPPGRRLVEDSLNRWLKHDHGAVVVEGVSGRLPFELKVAGIRLEDREGRWLDLDDLRLRWSWSELLFRRTVQVSALTARRVSWGRMPAGREREDEREDFDWADLAWQWRLPPLLIEELAVERLVLSRELLGEEVALALRARLAADRDGLILEQGRIGRLDGFADELDFSLEIGGQRDWRLSARLDLTLDKRLLPQWLADYGGERLVGDLRLSLLPADRKLSGGLNLAMADLALHGVGGFDLPRRKLAGALELVSNQPGRWLAPAGADSTEPIRLQLTAAGVVEAPRLWFDLKLGEVRTATMACEALGLTGRLDLARAETGWEAETELRAAVSGWIIEGYPQLPPEAVLEVEAKYHSGTRLQVEEMALYGGSLQAAAAGEVGTVEFTPTEPGEYRFYCSVPGHERGGMAGLLIVE